MTSVSPVGDAGAAALCQLEGVLQLLNSIGVPATTGPVLPSQLEERRVMKIVLIYYIFCLKQRCISYITNSKRSVTADRSGLSVLV